jgi:23S rRNA pseudouridine1911/1915/1917 synthase
MELRHIATRPGRLSSFLKGELKMSTGLMNKLKWGDAITVNGRPEHTDFAVSTGDVIAVRLDEPKPEYPAEDAPLTILYEDDHILLVDKPAGMLIHPSRSQFSGTLANRVLGYYLRTGQDSAFHPVTRLDRDTYGVVLLAKNSHIHTLLQETEMEKVYHALVYGQPEGASGTIDAPIARKALPSLLREISPEGKPSVTEFQVLERNGKLCKLELHPITGRTHQLRLHCAHMGWPILGDPQYASDVSKQYSEELGLKSQLLCAKSLRFAHPITGKTIFVQSTMDAELER